MKNKCCGEHRPHLNVGSNGSGIEFSPDHLRGTGTDPERFLKYLGDLGMDIFEIGGNGRLQALSGLKGYIQRIGSRYTDLVLLVRH